MKDKTISRKLPLRFLQEIGHCIRTHPLFLTRSQHKSTCAFSQQIAYSGCHNAVKADAVSAETDIHFLEPRSLLLSSFSENKTPRTNPSTNWERLDCLRRFVAKTLGGTTKRFCNATIDGIRVQLLSRNRRRRHVYDFGKRRNFAAWRYIYGKEQQYTWRGSFFVRGSTQKLLRCWSSAGAMARG